MAEFSAEKEMTMFRRVFSAVFTMVLMALMTPPLAAWAAPDFLSAKQIVEALENSWDEAAQQPKQPSAEGLAVKELGGLKSRKTAAGEVKIMVTVNYPQGLGNKAVDDLVAKYAEEKLKVFESDANEFLNENQENPGLKSLIFVVSRPSPKYVSVVFYDSGFLGGAHGYRVFESKNYDLEKGLELKPADVYANPEDAEDTRPQQFFVNYINAALDKNCFDTQKEASFCAPAGVTVENLGENLHNIALTSAGFSVIYGPYEQGSYAEGTKFVDVPKDDLINWGISDKFWK